MAIPSSKYFNSADWIVIVVYLLAMIAIGVWFSRGQKTARDYFLGNKDLSWWSVGLSIVATETSALTFIGVPAIAFGGNLDFIQIIIGYVLARIVLAVVLVPHYFKGNVTSPYQMFGNAFGLGAQRTGALFFLISGTLGAGVRVYVTCIPIQLMLGIDILPSIILFVVLSLVYTYVGGIKAVIWTDAIQFILFMLGGIFTLVYVPTLLDGGVAEAFTLAAKAGKLQWFSGAFSWSMPFNIWMGLIGATVHVMSSHGADQLIVQRVLACGSVSEGRKALTLSAVIILPLFLIFLLTGVMLWVYYQKFPLPIPIPATQAGIGKSDYIYPIFIMTAVPNVLKGFLVVAILSAAMSSVSSALSALASVSSMDLFKPRTRSEGQELKWSKFSTLFWAAMLILVAYASREVTAVLNAAFTLTGLTSGAMLGGLLLAIWRPFGTSRPLVVGMLASLALMTAISVLPKSAPDFWTSYIGRPLAWPWYTMFGSAATIIVAMAVAKLTGDRVTARN